MMPETPATFSMRLDAPTNTRDQDVDCALNLLRLALFMARAGREEEFLGDLDETGSIIAIGPDMDSPDEVWLPSDFWFAHAPEAKA